jgi:hypothetical protein
MFKYIFKIEQNSPKRLYRPTPDVLSCFKKKLLISSLILAIRDIHCQLPPVENPQKKLDQFSSLQSEG